MERAEELGLLRKIRAVIERPENWTSGAGARDDEGRAVPTEAPYACCWCLIGAARKAAAGYAYFNGMDFENAACLAILALTRGCDFDNAFQAITFNDTSTHAEVLARLDAGIERLAAAIPGRVRA